jgi:hypothetical protein
MGCFHSTPRNGLDKHGRLHKQPIAKQCERNGREEHGIGSYVDVAGLLRLTITRAHMRQKGHYNVTMSMGLQV